MIRAEADGSFVRLRDIARVELGSQAYNAISKINNLPSASIAVYQSPGANALAVADQVYAELEDMAASFPPGVAYDILYDTTDSVRASIQEVITTLFITFVLVVLVTFMFLGDWRSTLIPTIAIPVSLIGAFALLFVLGFSANMVTLFAVIPGDRNCGRRQHRRGRERSARDVRDRRECQGRHPRCHGRGHGAGDRDHARAARRVRARDVHARHYRRALQTIRAYTSASPW